MLYRLIVGGLALSAKGRQALLLRQIYEIPPTFPSTHYNINVNFIVLTDTGGTYQLRRRGYAPPQSLDMRYRPSSTATHVKPAAGHPAWMTRLHGYWIATF